MTTGSAREPQRADWRSRAEWRRTRPASRARPRVRKDILQSPNASQAARASSRTTLDASGGWETPGTLDRLASINDPLCP